MKTAIFTVLGSKKSGKTTTIENVTKELSERHYKIAVVKHVSEPNFTIDSRAKDSWRFAQAGARTVITVADNEVAIIEKMNTKNLSLDGILQKCGSNDAVFIEGLRNLVAKDKRVQKIVVVESAEEASEAVKIFDPILAFTGSYSTKDLILKPLYVDVVRNPGELADIIESFIKKDKTGLQSE